jgi:cell division protein FtsW (lipid II flippase)
MGSERSEDIRPTARQHWEVYAAAAIMILVVAVIDATAVRDPLLALALGPFIFLVLAALVGVTAGRGVAWIAACVLTALLIGDAQYAGLAYPAVAVVLALGVRHLVARRR